ncbi:RNA polymerase subunit sigma-70 [Rhodoferax koreense]|uniref:RNA polymerase subunit sigma-70 n=1 Tax=Rhodoferax koreensis TaxID=1842727 RepID=A0A1P8JXQ9_9BURK|nr:anti-sigma factor [Rhodoferax koreense]APW38543.1 RNA polymerase subunit sigma-70 [Rhodoferax koreense]
MSAAPGDDDLAAEYVLGTLSAARRREVEARIDVDAELRAEVLAWQERLLPLTALAEPVAPSAQLWQRIERSLAPSKMLQARPARGRFVGWWDNLQLWRGLAGTGFAAAAVLAGVLVTRLSPVPAPQYMVVLVAPQDKAPGWVVQTSDSRRLSLIPLGATAVPAEKSLQFWTKGDNWSGPVSLGLVKPGETVQIPLDKLPPLQPNQLFELTLEPANGSPIDRPTGPIQFIGRAVKLI